MDPLTIVGVIVGFLFAGFLFFGEDAFVVLTIQNEGSSPAKFATIQAKDTSGNPVYPIPYLQDEQWKDSSGEKAQSQLRKDFVNQKLATQCSKRFT